jgi:ubiquinone/menaquinone biosynthesis C-methylase UbiE
MSTPLTETAAGPPGRDAAPRQYDAGDIPGQEAAPAGMSPRKQALWRAAEALAPRNDRLNARNRYFHDEDARYLRFLIGPGQRILELGCGTGNLLAALAPSLGVGVDFSPAMIALARQRHPDLTFQVGDVEDPALFERLGGRRFDVILMSDIVGSLDDVQRCFAQLHRFCTPETRIVVGDYSRGWEPILRTAEALDLKTPTPSQNWLSSEDIARFMALCDFEEIRRELRVLLPKRLLGIGPFINRFVATLPLLRRLCVRSFLLFRSRLAMLPETPSVSVIIPVRNERGNIENAIRRLPIFAREQEIIFVEGHSGDGTLEEINRVIGAYPQRRISAAVQDGKGKGQAVRQGFDMARGDILIILDGDLTVPPEDIPKFYDVLASGRGEFANGSRLVYPLERESMRFLNLLANRLFALFLGFMLNQRLTDTLCGTKAMSRSSYRRLAQGRGYFGDFDPFGDFDLIFGAAKLNLKSVEIPVRYFPRTYGQTQISRFRHGWMLLKMALVAWWKFKAI